MNKRLLAPERLRELPDQFSWINQQLVRGGFLRRCDHSAWALYLFLTTVADSQGLSYYSDGSVCRWLNVDPAQLLASRQQLIAARLLAYHKPLYQLLDLPVPQAMEQPRTGQTYSLGELFRKIAGGAS